MVGQIRVSVQPIVNQSHWGQSPLGTGIMTSATDIEVNQVSSFQMHKKCSRNTGQEWLLIQQRITKRPGQPDDELIHQNWSKSDQYPTGRPFIWPLQLYFSQTWNCQLIVPLSLYDYVDYQDVYRSICNLKKIKTIFDSYQGVSRSICSCLQIQTYFFLIGKIYQISPISLCWSMGKITPY